MCSGRSRRCGGRGTRRRQRCGWGGARREVVGRCAVCGVLLRREVVLCFSVTLKHMVSKNITLTMPEELLRRAKVIAAQRDTSVSGLVAELLRQLTGPEPDYATAWAAEEQLMEEGVGLRVGEITWTREDLHDR